MPIHCFFVGETILVGWIDPPWRRIEKRHRFSIVGRRTVVVVVVVVVVAIVVVVVVVAVVAVAAAAAAAAVLQVVFKPVLFPFPSFSFEVLPLAVFFEIFASNVGTVSEDL